MQRRDLLLTAVGAGAAATSPTEAQSPRPIPARTTIRTRDGVGLFHREWGEGRPVLFVHAWAMSSEMWAYQFADLESRGLRCIAFDRRGHGRSDAPAGGYDLNALADDLASVIEQLGLRDVALVGHSMGCAEILRYIGRHGTERLRRVAFLAPVTPFVTQTADNPFGAPAAYFETVRAEMKADFAGWIDRNAEPFVTPDTSEGMRAWLKNMMRETPVPVALACNRAMAATDLRPDLARVDRPTLVIHGDRDASAPLDITGRRTAAGIVGARLQVIEGAPHGLFVTHKAQVNTELARFLS